MKNRVYGLGLWIMVMGVLSLGKSLGLIIFINAMIAAFYIIGGVDKFVNSK